MEITQEQFALYAKERFAGRNMANIPLIKENTGLEPEIIRYIRLNYKDVVRKVTDDYNKQLKENAKKMKAKQKAQQKEKAEKTDEAE